MRLAPLLPLIPLFACDTAAPPEQLELASAVLDVSDEEFQEVSASGTLNVTGADGDFQLLLGEEDVQLAITVHSPGHSDLSSLDGLTLDASLPIFGFSEERSLLLQDEAGLAYALDAGFSVEAVNAALGREVVRFGEVQATQRGGLSDWTLDYTTVHFESDDGPVALFPGEVTDITVDGVRYRAAAVSAVDRTPGANTPMPGCPVLEDILSYELLRVDAQPEEELLARPEGLEAASLGCI